MAIHIAESELEQQLVVDGDGSFADGLRRRGIAVDAARPLADRAARPARRARRAAAAHSLRARRRRRHRDDRAQSGRAVAHCPVSNAKLGHGVAPLDELLAAGHHRRTRLGLDGEQQSHGHARGGARSRCLRSARVSDRSETPTAADVLELATIGGARGARLGDVVGSLEVGKQADLAAFALDAVGPTQDPVDRGRLLAHRRARAFVSVAGKPLVRDGELVARATGLARSDAGVG